LLFSWGTRLISPFLQIRGAAEPPNPTQFFIRKVLVVVRQYFELDRRGGRNKENSELELKRN
jgi:hypothetical protein